MRPTITRESIKKSACGKLNPHLDLPTAKKTKVVKPRNDCPEVQWMHWQLKYFCIDEGLTLLKEHHFAKPRKLRFDFAIEEEKLAIEYDGINSEKSGHTTLVGFTKDTEKINLAISMGWRVLRFSVKNYQKVLQEVRINLKTKNQK